MAQKQPTEVRNTLLNIRDVIGIFAIITLIPILAYRAAGIFIDWHGLSEQYKNSLKQIEKLEDEQRDLEKQRNYYLEREKLQEKIEQRRQEIQKEKDAETPQERLTQVNKRIKEMTTQEQQNKSEEEIRKEINTRIEELSTKIRNLRDERQSLEETMLQYRFYTSLGVGIASLLIGILIPLFHVGIGFLIGGIITLSYGYWIYWDYMSDILATISIIFALIILTFGIWYYRPRTT